MGLTSAVYWPLAGTTAAFAAEPIASDAIEIDVEVVVRGGGYAPLGSAMARRPSPPARDEAAPGDDPPPALPPHASEPRDEPAHPIEPADEPEPPATSVSPGAQDAKHPPLAADDAGYRPTPATSSTLPERSSPRGIVPDPAHRRLVVAGDVVAGLGIGAFIAMTAGLVLRSDAASQRELAEGRDDADAVAKYSDRVSLGDRLALSAGIVAAVGIATGVALIGVGRSRERKRQRALGVEVRGGLGGVLLRF